MTTTVRSTGIKKGISLNGRWTGDRVWIEEKPFENFYVTVCKQAPFENIPVTVTILASGFGRIDNI